jgi:hypothetical protein
MAQRESGWMIAISDFLNVGKHEECDLEAGARIGKFIFWIGSHGTDSDGNEQRGPDMSIAVGYPALRPTRYGYTNSQQEFAGEVIVDRQLNPAGSSYQVRLSVPLI